MNISELVKKAHDNAVKKGFYDCPECQPEGSDECESCGGLGYDLHKNIGELLMLVVSELGEAIEAHREGDLCGELVHDDPIEMDFFEDHIKDSFESELADAVIRIADMCGYLGIDLEKHIELKMKYNATREYKHGKRY